MRCCRQTQRHVVIAHCALRPQSVGSCCSRTWRTLLRLGQELKKRPRHDRRTRYLDQTEIAVPTDVACPERVPSRFDPPGGAPGVAGYVTVACVIWLAGSVSPVLSPRFGSCAGWPVSQSHMRPARSRYRAVMPSTTSLPIRPARQTPLHSAAKSVLPLVPAPNVACDTSVTSGYVLTTCAYTRTNTSMYWSMVIGVTGSVVISLPI